MEWEKDYNDAIQFSKKARNFAAKGIVDNETLYHLISMSIEKYASALASSVNYMPEHSGLGFIFRALKEKMEIPPDFLDEIRFLNGFMTYCSLDFEEPRKLSDADINRIFDFEARLQTFCGAVLK